MSIGALIKARLKALGLNQTEVCERSGLSTGFLSDVINDKKRLGADGARRLSPVLELSITQLLGEASADVEQWFWPAKFASITADDLASLRRLSIEQRISWVLTQLQDAYPDMDLAGKLNLPPDQVDQLLRGESIATEKRMATLTEALQLPEHFVKAGEPGPNTDLARQVFARHNATEWLSVIKFAMDNDVPPVKVLDAIRLFLTSVQ